MRGTTPAIASKGPRRVGPLMLLLVMLLLVLILLQLLLGGCWDSTGWHLEATPPDNRRLVDLQRGRRRNFLHAVSESGSPKLSGEPSK